MEKDLGSIVPGLQRTGDRQRAASVRRRTDGAAVCLTGR
ncbi:hypothetical protein BURMUCF1_2264 [Burkholderia multivorans ATCC BAA-247]|nr:hypothetical protein BURMUCF1_2264 [Burkholderia multivorans ATCC BAA-247]